MGLWGRGGGGGGGGTTSIADPQPPRDMHRTLHMYRGCGWRPPRHQPGPVPVVQGPCVSPSSTAPALHAAVGRSEGLRRRSGSGTDQRRRPPHATSGPSVRGGGGGGLQGAAPRTKGDLPGCTCVRATAPRVWLDNSASPGPGFDGGNKYNFAKVNIYLGCFGAPTFGLLGSRPPLPPEGCISRVGPLKSVPEAVGQAVGGRRQSGWGRLLSVTNAVEAGTWRQRDSGWA